MRIAVGSDHRGVNLRTKIVKMLTKLGHDVVDVGSSDGGCVDYPDVAALVAHRLENVAGRDVEGGVRRNHRAGRHRVDQQVARTGGDVDRGGRTVVVDAVDRQRPGAVDVQCVGAAGGLKIQRAVGEHTCRIRHLDCRRVRRDGLEC